jgi:hypothetical protein
VANYILTALFTMEMAIKVVALGFVWEGTAGGGAAVTPGAPPYIRNGWNQLDFFIVLISLVTVAPSGSTGPLTSLRALRALRALRPLRMSNRAPGLRVVVDALMAAIPGAINVILVCMLFFLIFAIFFMNYFKGQFRRCGGDAFEAAIGADGGWEALLEAPVAWSALGAEQRAWFAPNSTVFAGAEYGGAADWSCAGLGDGGADAAAPTFGEWAAGGAAAPCCFGGRDWSGAAADALTSRDLCACWGFDWEREVPQSFDNALAAFLSLFEIATTEGWVDVMYSAVDATGVDMQPIKEFESLWTIVFQVFMLFGSYLFLNLFVGVTIDNFNRMHSAAGDSDDSLFMTKEQILWSKTQKVCARGDRRSVSLARAPPSARSRGRFSAMGVAPRAVSRARRQVG